jgi:UDP-N-acetylglucosamine 3-dehydrogenase
VSAARLRVVLVGVGRFGRNHLRVLQAFDRAGRIELAGVVVSSAARARALARRFGVHAYPLLDAALADGIDVVDLATPARTHASLVRCSLPHAHVFVEKPLALTAGECGRLFELARRHSRVLGVGHIFRFNHAVSRIRRMLARGRRPHWIRVEMTGSSPPPDDVGAVLTFLHVFDVLDQLVETPPRRTIPIARVVGHSGLESHAVVSVAYPHGLSALVEVGWIGGAKRRVLEVSFEDRLVRCDLVSQVIEVLRASRPPRVLRAFRGEPLRDEIVHFLDAIRRGREPRPSPAEVLRVMKMVGDAQRALTRGSAVSWRS